MSETEGDFSQKLRFQLYVEVSTYATLLTNELEINIPRFDTTLYRTGKLHNVGVGLDKAVSPGISQVECILENKYSLFYKLSLKSD